MIYGGGQNVKHYGEFFIGPTPCVDPPNHTVNIWGLEEIGAKLNSKLLFNPSVSRLKRQISCMLVN